jgi:hypothetical protein
MEGGGSDGKLAYWEKQGNEDASPGERCWEQDLPLTKPRFSLSRLASRAFCQGIDVDTFKENVMTVMSRRAQDVLRGTKSGPAAYCFTISQVHQKPSYSSLAVGHLHYD